MKLFDSQKLIEVGVLTTSHIPVYVHSVTGIVHTTNGATPLFNAAFRDVIVAECGFQINEAGKQMIRANAARRAGSVAAANRRRP